MKKAVIGILAHVDAGKTTLAEAVLYRTGRLRSLGRVDRGDTVMDTHELEKERGITIFAGSSVFTNGDRELTMLDTPGHVDFSSETERTLQVLDYAVLVISGTDGVQAHTRTLWRLLELYNIPVFIFVTKMDFARRSREDIMSELCSELGEGCTDILSEDTDAVNEHIAECSEDVLEKYLDTGIINDDDISRLVLMRKLFPCVFGSGLRAEGIDAFLGVLDRFMTETHYPDVFGAKVFKISHDKQGNRLTHMKITGGTLKVKDTVDCGYGAEKINQIRIYSGEKYVTVDEMSAGGVCVVTGLEKSKAGLGLGHELTSEEPVLEPVMNYRISLPDGIDAQTMLPKLRLLEEEDPQLHITWNPFLQEIHVWLMGEVQTEILKSLILQRFDTDVTIDSGRVLYKETVKNTVEGVGHYEPLRHYAEVHLLIEPLPRGRGVEFGTKCSENVLDRNWQRLILTHLAEKEHLGVLTGSPLTDVRITLAAGRAHLKHTEGGDFRQATYRAVRQGLMQAESVLLEPYYRFRLEVPYEQMGRAISDIRLMCGELEDPSEHGDFALIKGKAPVVTMNGYAAEVAAYTGGRGKLICENAGYFECHDSEKVIESAHYVPDSDLDNTPDSVFCAHGSGFNVKWDRVKEYMHLESCLEKEIPYEPQLNKRNFHIDDKELEAIMARTFGTVKYELYRPSRKASGGKSDSAVIEERKQYVIVDGYNVIFAWDELKDIARTNLENAREALMNTLCNYSAYTKNEVILVFDAYRVAGGTGETFDYHNIRVAYTKERELGDVYIEKLISEIGKNDRVRVVTSDRLIQLSAVRFGVLRMSSAEFYKEVEQTRRNISDELEKIKEENARASRGLDLFIPGDEED